MSATIPDLRKMDGGGAAIRMFAYACFTIMVLVKTVAPLGVIEVYAAACIAPAVIAYMQSKRLRNAKAPPKAMKSVERYPGDRRAFRQRLTQNPFDSSEPDLELADRITNSAEICVGFGRRAIVLSLSFADLDPATVRECAEAIRRSVRCTDLVEIVAGSEILIGLAMVQDYGAADIVTKRIHDALGALPASRADQVKSGASIYPLHGYTGADLISAARKRSQGWAPLRVAAPAPAADQLARADASSLS